LYVQPGYPIVGTLTGQNQCELGSAFLREIGLQGQTLLEMADRLDTPVGTINRRLHTTRKRLKAELQAGSADAFERVDDPGRDEDDDLVDDKAALMA
jgi:hypothetical protein